MATRIFSEADIQPLASRLPIRAMAAATRSAPLMLALFSFSLLGCESLSFQRKHDSPVMVQAPRRVEKGDPDQESVDDEQVKSRVIRNATKSAVKSAPEKRVTRKKADNPVKMASSVEDASQDPQVEVASKEFDGSDLKSDFNVTTPKNPWDNWRDDTAIFNAQVAATVNGAPILNGDILEPYAGYLISVREEIQKAAKNPKPGQPIPSPDEYEKFRYSLIQRQIFVYIQRKLLVERLKSGLKPEQIKLMDDHVNEMFEKEIENLKRNFKVTNKSELELALNKMGTTLANRRDNFALERLAMECVGVKGERPAPIERPDLVAYYQSNPDKFTFEAKVKWQHLQVSITPESGKRAARKKLEQALEELQNGASFEKVARKYSDGPTAKQGGTWDWMEAGNLKDKALEKKLFTMPMNELSEICESEDALCVVRVIDRQEAGRKPFHDVQEEIRKILEDEQLRNRPKKLFKELFSNAVIETQYSIPQFGQDD